MSQSVACRYIKKLKVDGFASRGADFPDVACVFDGTLVRTRQPRDFQGFYDKSGKLSYNCLAAVDHRWKFGYFGVFSGSNSDQSMWTQSEVLGARALERLAGFVANEFSFNYHLSQTRILVECAFGRLKARFKVLHGVTDRHSHTTNARMISAAAVLHNILIDIGDKQFKAVRDEES
ncbi:hypothetical protein PHMEG_00031374 [Phytophthora megakarya]|uniref:DDE Tnp4 domain-containing protein n=1 Tax=Phytophthora megakarya TaxID=4795 RepID=A0A225UY62_9STRA|nr:hypothetical protein PHMEG_00031374 [Phytophthora megakarya]